MTETQTSRMIDAALRVAGIGLRVLPLRGKIPTTPHGCKDASTDAAIIRDWWTREPLANIGVATGPESGIFVVDLDGDFELPFALQNLPRTVTSKTCRGRHLFFRYPSGRRISKRARIGGLPIDVRGEGGYVVAPPSVHPSGAVYRWIDGPDDAPLAEADQRLLDLIDPPKPGATNGSSSHSRASPKTSSRVLDRAAKYLDKIPGAVSGCGGHGQTYTAAVAMVYGFDLGIDAAFALLWGHYNPRCQPPWTEKELRHKIDDANTKPHDKPRGWLLNESNHDGAHHHDPATGSPPSTGKSIVEVIRDYFRASYGPTFRRGANVWSELQGRDVTRAEACAAPTSDLIPALLAATDFPRSKEGLPMRSAVPGQFRQWSFIAWADLLASLDDEADSPEIADKAAEQFKTRLADGLMHIESFSHRYCSGKEEKHEVQRRSLIEWCHLFAKPGPWKGVRSLSLWCCLDDKGQLRVAVHQRLFGQIRRGNLGPSTHRGFAQLCELYGAGSAGRTSRARFVELSPEFLRDLIETPCDGKCDDDGDARFTRARANSASHDPSHVDDVNDVTEDP
jgi:hypothetical protein